MSKDFSAYVSVAYDAWLDSEKHSQLTGSEAQIKAEEGSAFTAWDGYISGKITELVPNQKIVQTWRTTAFAEEAEDSILTVSFYASKRGCKIQLDHTNIPKGDGPKYKKGWKEHYFEPMEKYFNSL